MRRQRSDADDVDDDDLTTKTYRYDVTWPSIVVWEMYMQVVYSLSIYMYEVFDNTGRWNKNKSERLEVLI